MITALEGTEVTNHDREELISQLGNWIKLSSYLKSVEDEHTILRLMKMELAMSRRPEIMFRLYSRYNSLRRNREREELMKLIANA